MFIIIIRKITQPFSCTISIIKQHNVCLLAGMYVCLQPISSGTAGQWTDLAKSFLLTLSLSLSGFRPKNLDTGFLPSFLHIYSKYFLAKIFEYKILKNAWNIKLSFYKFSNILSFDVEGQTHFQKPLEANDEAASI